MATNMRTWAIARAGRWVSVTLSSSVAISVLSCTRVQNWAQVLLINLFPVHNVVYRRCEVTHVKQLLAIVCPKILKIMPVDAYNASIIIKCLYCSKLCRHNLPTPIYALLDL